MTVNNFSTALEAKRCIDALDRIESDILARRRTTWRRSRWRTRASQASPNR